MAIEESVAQIIDKSGKVLDEISPLIESMKDACDALRKSINAMHIISPKEWERLSSENLEEFEQQSQMEQGIFHRAEIYHYMALQTWQAILALGKQYQELANTLGEVHQVSANRMVSIHQMKSDLERFQQKQQN